MSRRASELASSRTLLGELGFEFAPPVLTELAEQEVKEKLSLLRFLDLVAMTEHERHEERRVKTGLRLSGLPVGKTLEGFDFLFQPGIDKGRVELLATCEFACRPENVQLLGLPGVDKTHLAVGLGVKAVQAGFSVTYLAADELIEHLRTGVPKLPESGCPLTSVQPQLATAGAQEVSRAPPPRSLYRKAGRSAAVSGKSHPHNSNPRGANADRRTNHECGIP